MRDVAGKLMNTESYKTQDSENNGDESFYMLSWYNDRYFMFCYYANRPNSVASFRTYSPEFTFAWGIKVGTFFSDEISNLFGDFGSWSAAGDTFDINASYSASITAKGKLNVRSVPGTHGNVLFQVENQNSLLFVAKSSSAYDNRGSR